MNETRDLARFLAELSFADLPAELVARAKLLLLDHIGVSLFATRTEWGRIVTNYALRFARLPESTLYGTRTRVAAEYAALANGTAAHGYELDDSHEGGYSHPGAPVIPAALAMAELHGRTGADVLLAMAAGYDVMGRIGNALGAEGIKRHHPTGQFGAFGAAVAVAKVLSANEAQLRNALGIAGSMASGIMQFADDPDGAMVKRLHGGWPAHGGTVAGQLAMSGFTGPGRVLEGRFGFLRSITGTFDDSRLSHGLGSTWELMRTAVKLYPTCRAFHPMIEAIENIKRNNRVQPSEIVEVSVGATSKAISQQMIYQPTSLMAAQYSLPFCAAWAFHCECSDPLALTEDLLQNPEILDTTTKVTTYLDDVFDVSYPRYAGRVRVRLADGRSFEEEVWDAKGSSLKPAAQDDIVRKFKTLTAGILASPDAVLDEVADLERTSSLQALTRAIQDVVA